MYHRLRATQRATAIKVNARLMQRTRPLLAQSGHPSWFHLLAQCIQCTSLSSNLMEQRYEKPSRINPTCANQRRDQDLDAIGGRLNGTNRYTVTFAKDQTPPVNGFWSLTLYNEHHFFAPNEMKRFSLGTKNKNLKYNSDGSLTLYVQADPPPAAQRDNWLPAPRAYWPRTAVSDGTWTPPAVQKVN